MRSTQRISIVTVALVLACAAIPAVAQRAKRSISGDPAAKLIKKFNAAVKPSPEQQKKLTPLWSQYRKDAATWQMTNKAKVTELKRQMSVKGKEKYAKQQLAILYSGKQKINRSLLSRMSGVLTPTQMPKAEQVLDPKKSAPTQGSKSLQKLGLNAEQMTQANTIMAEAKTQASKTDDPAVKDALMRDAMARVRNSVMTDEQKTAWDATQKRPTIRPMRTDDGKSKEQASEGETSEKKEGRSRRGWGGVELSEEQQEQMTAIREKAREAMKSAETREEKMAVWRESHQEMKDVYTDEQKEQMTAAREKARKEGTERFMKAIEATDEQREAFTEIMADARKAASETDDWSEKREIYRETFETLKKEVFTEEQVKKMEEMRNNRRRGGRRGGNRGGGEGREGGRRGGDREGGNRRDRDNDSDTE